MTTKQIKAARAAMAMLATLAPMTALTPAVVRAQSYNPNAVYQSPDAVMPGVSRQAWASQPCRDPWINIAYAWGWGTRPVGAGDQGECWPGQYAQGRWRDYNQLVHSIARYRQCMQANRNRVIPAAISDYGNQVSFVIVDSGGRLVGNDSASLVAQGGGTLVGSNGATLSRRQLYSLPNLMGRCGN